jgi:hypothetical protein
MSASYSLSSLTEPERDMLIWYRLPEPVQYPLRPVATIPVPYESPANDSSEVIVLPEAA